MNSSSLTCCSFSKNLPNGPRKRSWSVHGVVVQFWGTRNLIRSESSRIKYGVFFNVTRRTIATHSGTPASWKNAATCQAPSSITRLSREITHVGKIPAPTSDERSAS